MSQDIEHLQKSSSVDRWLFPGDTDLFTGWRLAQQKRISNAQLINDDLRHRSVDVLFSGSPNRWSLFAEVIEGMESPVVRVIVPTLKEWRQYFPAIDPYRVYPVEDPVHAWAAVGVTDADLCLSVFSRLLPQNGVEVRSQIIGEAVATRILKQITAQPLSEQM